MRWIKRLCACMLLMLYMNFIPGCSFIKYTYAYDQSMDNIEMIELHRYDYTTKSHHAFMALELNTGKSLLNEFKTLDCYKPFGDHANGYGKIVVYITYKNGKAEVIGVFNSASIDVDGSWLMKSYYFDRAEWATVILKYVDADLIPELKEYFEN